MKDTALLHRVKMQKQGQIPLENLTKEEEISSSKSDPELGLNDNEDFSHSEERKHLKLLKKRAENPKADTIVHEYITCSGRITSFRLSYGLQRDETQIRKTPH